MAQLKKTAFIPTDLNLCFFLLAASNTLLSYFPISATLKGWVFSFGVLIPLFFLFSIRPKKTNDKPFESRGDFLIPWWVGTVLILLALWLRLFKLTTFHLWPTGDEALHGFLAIPLARHWNWQFFYTVGEHPPLLIWCLSFFFKYFDSPFFNLWFLPALLSAAAVPIGYWAVRPFFSKAVSFSFVFLLAFSFWPLYFGRFCHQGVFIPFFELFGFWLLGGFLKADTDRGKSWLVFFLGLWTGLGSWTFTSWAVVILLTVLTVLVICLKNFKKDIRFFFLFLSGFFLTFLPFLLAAFREGYGHHLMDSSAASQWFSRSHQVLTYASYVTCFFWGNLQPGASYAPSWGGMLNPFLASCFFFGLAELFYHRKNSLSLWLAFGFLICLLPGFLSADYVEFNRVIQALPFLLMITAIGLEKVLVGFSKNKGAVIFIILALLSTGLDWTHLLKPQLEEPWSRLEFKREVPDDSFKAYKILEENFKTNGPGIIFTEFMLLSHGHMLSTTAYHFNAALNPKWDKDKAQWAGVIVNRQYQPFLLKRFPDSKWTFVTNEPADDGGTAVGLIPIDSNNRTVLERWSRAHDYFHQLSFQAENILNNKQTYDNAVSRLADGYPLMKGDPFLESVFGEWLAQYHYGPTCQKNISVIQGAVARGYPSPHLYYKLGGFFIVNHQFAQARQAYEAAARSRFNYTNAADLLLYLKTPPLDMK